MEFQEESQEIHYYLLIVVVAILSCSKGFGSVVTKSANVNIVASAHASHSFSDEEKISFVEYINDVLGKVGLQPSLSLSLALS